MPSTFAWIDIDEKSRRKMLEIVSTFRDQDTVDELGLGIIRDAFADYFFPGTSTVQTRARYFLFVPWIYRQLEKKEVTSSEIARLARAAEIRLIRALKRKADESDGMEGIIGRRSVESLKRLPSNIYWAGLREWKILRFQGNQEQYHRSLNEKFYEVFKSSRLAHDGESEKEISLGRSEPTWDKFIPKMPSGFPEDVAFDLTMEEAHYLREKILNAAKTSLLATFVMADEPINFEQDNNYLWNGSILAKVSVSLGKEIETARNFAFVMHGATLLYNCILLKQNGLEDGYGYIEDIASWTKLINDNRENLNDWRKNLKGFWMSEALRANIRSDISRLKAFVEEWSNLIFEKNGIENLADNKEAFALIRRREIQVKGHKKARIGNEKAGKRWEPRRVGIMDYRWGRVNIIVNDIIEGLNRR